MFNILNNLNNKNHIDKQDKKTTVANTPQDHIKEQKQRSSGTTFINVMASDAQPKNIPRKEQ